MEAKDDLIYKISDVDKGEFEALKLTDTLTFERALQCYRALTGSCRLGMKDFVERMNISKRKKYSVKEIISLTKGEYGHSAFKLFFEKQPQEA
jgi:hypothetical protein